MHVLYAHFFVILTSCSTISKSTILSLNHIYPAAVRALELHSVRKARKHRDAGRLLPLGVLALPLDVLGEKKTFPTTTTVIEPAKDRDEIGQQHPVVTKETADISSDK